MKKIKVSKKLIALFALTFTLSACKEVETPSMSYNTSIEVVNEEDPQEVIEVQEEQEKVVDNYNIDETYISISQSYEAQIEKEFNSESIYSASIRETMKKYRIDITPGSNFISRKYLLSIIDSINIELKNALKYHPYNKIINLDLIVFNSSYDLKDGKLYNRLFMYEEDYQEIYNRLTDSKERTEQLQKILKYRVLKQDFINNFNEFIITKDEEQYISVIDYALLNTNKTVCYVSSLEEIFDSLPSATESEIEKYKSGVLKKYGINLDNNKELFNPNNIEEIESIFKTYVNKCFELPDSFYSQKYDDKEAQELDYKRIVMKYIAINENLTDDTINYLVKTYIPTYDYLKPAELRTLATNNYYIEIGDESLASIQGINGSLSLYTNNYLNNNLNNKEVLSSLAKQKLSLNNLEKLCKELYLMQKVYQSNMNPTTIKGIITKTYVNNFIDVCPLSQIEVEIPASFKPTKDDLNAIVLMLADDYMTNNSINLYRNIDIAFTKKIK